MLISDTFIYLELLKTASSHTRKILLDISGLDIQSHGKHTSLKDLPEGIDDQDKRIIGNVRNPWDWYVSHWAFGCQQRGGMYKRLKTHSLPHLLKSPLFVLQHFSRFRLNHIILHSCYSDAQSKEQFKKWLHFVLHKPTPDVVDASYAAYHHKNIGLFTYEYLKMYHDDPNLAISEIDTIKMDNLRPQHILKSEDLVNELLSISGTLGVTVDQMREAIEKNSSRTNSSERQAYAHYYDDESRAWISEKDRLINRIHAYDY